MKRSVAFLSTDRFEFESPKVRISKDFRRSIAADEDWRLLVLGRKFQVCSRKPHIGNFTTPDKIRR